MAIERVQQGFHALRPRLPAGYDIDVARILTPEQQTAFRALPAADQAHLLRVYRLLQAGGVQDHDLLTAGLLHDLGKVAGNGHVRLIDRVGHVVLGKLAPRLLTRWAMWPAPVWRRGLALAVHHPELGAQRAVALGCTPRTCWLIAHHHDPSALSDPDLRLLVVADKAAG